MPLRYYLIVFDLDRQRLVGEVRDFADDVDAAGAAYAELEAEHRGDRNLEIVLLGADSLDTIRRTHANYFGVTSSSQYLAGMR